MRLVLIGVLVMPLFAGCLFERSLPDTVYKDSEWTVHLISGCSEGSVVIDTLRFSDLSFSINRTGECLYIQAGRLFNLDAAATYRMELVSPSMDYFYGKCAETGNEVSRKAHVDWTVTFPQGKSKCHLWTQPDGRFDEPTSPYSLSVTWTKTG